MTVFDKIIAREIPAHIVYETDTVLAFRDIAPQAPVHVLVIPKRRIVSASDATAEDAEILGELLLAAAEVARREGVAESGYRLVINNGRDGGQSVFHIHVHVIGGKPLGWPPFPPQERES
jgi:histidine triad (HIT) family protein